MNNDDLKSTFEQARPAFPSWPADFDKALQSVVIVAMLRTLAKHPKALQSLLEKRAQTGDVRRRPYFDPEPSRPPILFDYKKRASGDDS